MRTQKQCLVSAFKRPLCVGIQKLIGYRDREFDSESTGFCFQSFNPNIFPPFFCLKVSGNQGLYAAPRYYLLKGSIYGQRSASREWHGTLAGWLGANGYKKQEDEPCAFINSKGFTVLAYVDDLICRGSQEEADKFYKLLGNRFDCKDYTILSPD